MWWIIVGGFLFSVVSCSQKRAPTLSDPLGLGGLGWQWQKPPVKDYVKGSIWPKPQDEMPDGVVYTLTPTQFSFNAVGQTSDVLEDAIARYKNLTFPDSVKTTKIGYKQITGLDINVIDKYEPLSLDSDESCKCNIYLDVHIFTHRKERVTS